MNAVKAVKKVISVDKAPTQVSIYAGILSSSPLQVIGIGPGCDLASLRHVPLNALQPEPPSAPLSPTRFKGRRSDLVAGFHHAVLQMRRCSHHSVFSCQMMGGMVAVC